jgi:hypothetical protein
MLTLGKRCWGIMAINVALGRILKKAKDSSSGRPKNESETEEKDSEKCSHHFGYLVKHPKNVPFPEECFLCSRLLECIVPK